MSVRLAPAEGDVTTAVAASPDIDPRPAGGGPRPASRRALRAARHHRHRLAIACMVVVAACLVATVLILGVARDRQTRPVPGGAGAVVTSPFHLTNAFHPTTRPGARAPEGGHR